MAGSDPDGEVNLRCKVGSSLDKVGVGRWGRNWLRFQALMTPMGSGLVALWLSQSENVGWLWNSQADYEVAARFVSVGILFYTGTFAILEAGVWILMVLALKALQDYDRRKEQRRREQLEKGAEFALQALRRSEETGEPYEEILRRLIWEEWKPD